MTDSTFLKKLRYWTPFVCINAAPSYLIYWDVAKQLLVRQHIGMTAGILLCVLGYAWATSRPLYHRWVESSSLGEAFRAALYLRTGMALVYATVVLPIVHFHPIDGPVARFFLSVLIYVDLMAGFFAGQIVELIGRTSIIAGLRRSITGPDPALRAQSEWIGDMNSLIPTMLTTIVEGIILSLGLAALAVGMWLTTKAWQWWRKPHAQARA